MVLETETEVLLPTEQAMLTLITCYPFDALKPGGPLLCGAGSYAPPKKWYNGKDSTESVGQF